MHRESFVFYRSFYEAIVELPRDIQGEVFTAIMEYGLNGITTENLKPIARSILTLIKPQIDVNNKRLENGKQGGAPVGNQNAKKTTESEPKNNQKQPKNNQKQPNENVNENVNEKEKNYIKKEKIIKKNFGEFVTMTDEEYSKLVDTHGSEFVVQCIGTLDNYKGSSGAKYKSDYRAILSWVVDRVNQKCNVVTPQEQANINNNKKIYEAKSEEKTISRHSELPHSGYRYAE